MQKNHYVYKITNLKSSPKYYIGVRSCKCLPDDDTNYMGSSIPLKESLNLLGIDNFHKEILSTWSTREEANSEEIRLHNLYNVDIDTDYYNICKATSTGFDTTHLVGEKNHFYGKKHSAELRAKWSNDRLGADNSFYGKKHSDKTKEQISKSWEINREERCRKISEAAKLTNYKIRTVKIYDNNNTLVHTVNTGFKRFLKENDMPPSFINSYSKNGQPLYSVCSPKARIKGKWQKYKGWYAVREY